MTTPAEYVRDNREALIALTTDLLVVKTVNPPGETAELADVIEAYLSDLSVAVERVAVDPAKPNLLAELPGESDRTLLFNGHLDTVPYQRSEWSVDPLGERTDSRLYGRGATDMKGPLAAMLFTIEAFVETETTPPVDLAFALVSDEEVGGDAGLPVLLDRNLIDGDACVIGEPTCEQGRHSVTVADRGSIWLELDAEGVAAHGSRPNLGTNAIDRLYAAVDSIREQFGSRKLDIEPAMEPILADSIEYYTPTMGEQQARTLFETPSINLGTIEGGEAINTVPQSAHAALDIRLTAGVQTPALLSEIRACVADCDRITITDVSHSIGTVEPATSPLVDAVASTAAAVTGERIFRRSATGGGDAKQLRNAGIPTVEFAFGTDTVHAVDEYITLDALAANATVYSRLPEQFADAVD